MIRYRTLIYDSARWSGFTFRPSDIVISTPPKCGTTWTQMLTALLIFDGPDFPAPLNQLSPWLDMNNCRVDEVFAVLEAQQHRRFIKTHTPLDGLPMQDEVTYLVVGRDPLDVASSFQHHMENLDLDSFMARRAASVGLDDLPDLPERPPINHDPKARFDYFVDDPGGSGVPTLATVMHHFDTAWQRRHEPNVSLFHYADYRTDLPAELERLAAVLGMSLPAGRAAELSVEADFERMRNDAEQLAPSAHEGHWRDTTAFFRSGALGEGRASLSSQQLTHFAERLSSLVEPDLAAWASHGRLRSGVDPGP